MSNALGADDHVRSPIIGVRGGGQRPEKAGAHASNRCRRVAGAARPDGDGRRPGGQRIVTGRRMRAGSRPCARRLTQPRICCGSQVAMAGKA